MAQMDLNKVSLNQPMLFMGLLLGAAFPYVYSSCIMRSVIKVFPAIAYDIR